MSPAYDLQIQGWVATLFCWEMDIPACKSLIHFLETLLTKTINPHQVPTTFVKKFSDSFNTLAGQDIASSTAQTQFTDFHRQDRVCQFLFDLGFTSGLSNVLQSNPFRESLLTEPMELTHVLLKQVVHLCFFFDGESICHLLSFKIDKRKKQLIPLIEKLIVAIPRY